MRGPEPTFFVGYKSKDRFNTHLMYLLRLVADEWKHETSYTISQILRIKNFDHILSHLMYMECKLLHLVSFWVFFYDTR